MSKQVRDPFGPIEWIVTAALTFLVVGAAAGAAWAGIEVAVSGSTSISFNGIGDDSVCTEVSDEAVPEYFAGGDGVRRAEGIRGFDRGEGRYSSTGWSVCLDDPSWIQTAASGVAPLGSYLLTLVGLFLLRRVIRTGRKDGLFVDATADRMRDLGWYLVGYALAWPFVLSAASAVIVTPVVRDAHWAVVLLHPDLSFALVVVALGVLSMSRILRHAVPMQEEIDATV